MKAWVSRHAFVAALIGVLSLGVAGSALAAAAGAPSKATVVVKGGESFKPNQFDMTTLRFAPGTITIRSGGTVTLQNTTTDPHTLSIVKRSQLPRTVNQLNNCAVCQAILLAHGINFNGPPTNGPPPHPVLDVGQPGFDTPGDSVIVGPKGSPRPRVTFKVTAKKGTTLYFLCTIHPWMQGVIRVK